MADLGVHRKMSGAGQKQLQVRGYQESPGVTLPSLRDYSPAHVLIPNFWSLEMWEDVLGL